MEVSYSIGRNELRNPHRAYSVYGTLTLTSPLSAVPAQAGQRERDLRPHAERD